MYEFLNYITENIWIKIAVYVFIFVGGILTALSFRRKKIKPVCIMRSTSLLQESVSKLDGLNIEYDNHPVGNLTVTNIAIWNAGKKILHQTDCIYKRINIYKTIVVCFFILLSLIVKSQPVGCNYVFAFHLVDSTGKTIDRHHPDFKNYQFTLKLGTNKNNGVNELFGTYDKILMDTSIKEQDEFPFYNKNYIYIEWKSIDCAYVEFLELLVKHGNDSMYMQLTGVLNDRIYLDSIVFKPGYKYYKTISDPYFDDFYYGVQRKNIKLYDKIYGVFNPVFGENDFTVIKPIENYIPITIRPTLSTNKDVVLFFSVSIMGTYNDYIDTNVNIDPKKRKIVIDLKEIVIGKNGFYGISAGMGELISSKVNLGILTPGTYTLQATINNRIEYYKLKVKSNEVSIKIDAQHSIFRLPKSNTINTK